MDCTVHQSCQLNWHCCIKTVSATCNIFKQNYSILSLEYFRAGLVCELVLDFVRLLFLKNWSPFSYSRKPPFTSTKGRCLILQRLNSGWSIVKTTHCVYERKGKYIKCMMMMIPIFKFSWSRNNPGYSHIWTLLHNLCFTA